MNAPAKSRLPGAARPHGVSHRITPTLRSAALASAASATLAACGGGDEPPPPISPAQAARFLAQASLSTRAEDIERVQALGYSGWLEAQMAMPPSTSRVDWLRARGYDHPDNRNSQAGANNMLWRKLLASPDVLRQRVALALSEILVVSVANLNGGGFKAFSAAAYMDLLEQHAFGNYRALLGAVSTSPAMGAYLSFRGNRKAAGDALPDENYARELMQLFTIGLVKLQSDGDPLRVQGALQETYDQADVSGLARVFTGWDLDTSVGSASTPDRVIRPMVQITSRHEAGAKTFLDTTIPANTPGEASLNQALDALMAHANVGPFIGRQLIQRLVTSHPSRAYVGRVAQAFNDNGQGGRGDLRAVIRAVLLDPEARSDTGLSDPSFGKLREPMLRFVNWARCYGLTSADDSWALGDLSDPATLLGQSPLRAPSVFNFFRPGYVPPNSPIGARTVPELQITTESSVAGYVNFMQRVVSGRGAVAGMTLDYSALQALVGDSASLLAALNLQLAAGQLSTATLSALKTALDSINTSTAGGQANRLHAALTLVLAAPEAITLT